MARGINKAIILGRLGKDPDTRYLPSEGAVTNFSLATSTAWKDKNTGQEQTKTEWHRCTAFNRLGEIAGQYLKKGSMVYIEGSLRTNEYTDKDGIKRYTTEIIVGELQMLDGKNSTGEQEHSSTTGTQVDNGFDDRGDIPFDDDIPF